MVCYSKRKNKRIKILFLMILFGLGIHFYLHVKVLKSNTLYTQIKEDSIKSVSISKSYISNKDYIQQEIKNVETFKKKFIIYTEGCKIPFINPFDPTYAHLLQPTPLLKCPSTPPLVEIVNNALKINVDVLVTYYPNQTLNYCSYEAISRDKSGISDNEYKFGRKHIFNLDSQKFKIKDEFFRVTCWNMINKYLYSNYHMVVLRTPDREKRAKMNSQSCLTCRSKSEQLNIALVLLDGTSTVNFKRMCSKTHSYITKTLKMTELQIHHKVADNTLVNLLPILTGKFIRELGWNMKLKDNFFDSYNYIWKNFTQQGYITYFVEDYPKISSFNYFKPGFKYQPVDYYGRPFLMAVDKYFLSKDKRCMGSKLQADVILDNMVEFMKVYQKDKYFALSITCRLTHDSVNDASTADQPYLRFFKKVKPLLNNTVLIFFSDHGSRFGEYRKTYFGRLEERLPFLFIYFPPWFKKKYPSLIKTVETNSKRLTTHFDIYETMKDILHFNPELIKKRLGTTPSPRSYSLFNKIPTSRSCKSSEIDVQWCTCESFVPENISNPVAISVANALVEEINTRIKHLQNLCATLSLGEILDVRKSEAEKFLLFNVDKKNQSDTDVYYQLTVTTEPSKAVFEGIVVMSNGTFKVKNDISRINIYGNQSDCVNDHAVKMFCFCY